MTGADPNTEWLKDCVELDGQGFIKTGTEVGPVWPLRRESLHAGNKFARSFRGGRYSRGEREAGGFSGGRGVNGGAVRAQSSGGITLSEIRSGGASSQERQEFLGIFRHAFGKLATTFPSGSRIA